jgi:hypothetical protein
MSKTDFKSTPEYSAWWDANREKLRNFSIYSKGAAIWNAALAAPSVASGAQGDRSAFEIEVSKLGKWLMTRNQDGSYQEIAVQGFLRIWQAAIAAQAKPSAEEYSEMLREFFCCYAAGGYNDGDSLVPIDRCKSKLEWIVEDQRAHAAILANSAPNKALVAALQTIRKSAVEKEDCPIGDVWLSEFCCAALNAAGVSDPCTHQWKPAGIGLNDQCEKCFIYREVDEP